MYFMTKYATNMELSDLLIYMILIVKLATENNLFRWMSQYRTSV